MFKEYRIDLFLWISTIMVSSSLLLLSPFLFILSPLFAQVENISNTSTIGVDNQVTEVDLLPSWTNDTVKQNIVQFVEKITDINDTNNYISREDRIAVFDNDGTLWSEKPLFFEVYYIIDQVTNAVSKNPELANKLPFEEILSKNLTVLHDLTEEEIISLITETHGDITQKEYNSIVKQWIQNARHPETNKLLTDMVYQPLLELLNYLEKNQFKLFIVTGGGIDFVRESLSDVYGIPRDQIIGSSVRYKYVDIINSTNMDINNNKSYIYKEPVIDFINDKYGKPENIALHIGKVPVIAVGNSDGDLQMLKYTDDNNPVGKSLKLMIHHDDSIREFSYDTRAENILKEAEERDWDVVSMKNDFVNIFPSEE